MPQLSKLLVAVLLLQLNWGFVLPSVLLLLIESPLSQLSLNPFGDEGCRTVRSCSSSTSMGGGLSILKGKLCPVVVTAESGSEDKIDESDNDEEAIGNPLGRPSVLSSVNQDLLVSSRLDNLSIFFLILKSGITAGTARFTPPSSVYSFLPPNELTLRVI